MTDPVEIPVEEVIPENILLATSILPEGVHPSLIIDRAGGDHDTVYVINDEIVIPGIEQSILDSIIAAYDPIQADQELKDKAEQNRKPLQGTQRLLFDHENRLRNLEGKPVLTEKEFLVLINQ